MSRLTRRAEADGVKAVWYGNRECFLEGEVGYEEADKLAHYEDLEEAGRLIELPCKPCERVWVANGCHEPWQTVFRRIYQIVNIMEIGWAIGYTKAEAEAKLAEIQKGE